MVSEIVVIPRSAMKLDEMTVACQSRRSRARVVIAEYVNLAEGFFERKETGLANGVLDSLARQLRPEEFDLSESAPGLT